MNEENVAALTAIVLEMAKEFTPNLDGIEFYPRDQRRVAEWLASQGVLVPSSLTRAQVESLKMLNSEYYGGNAEEDDEARALFVRSLAEVAGRLFSGS